jgi:V/A-type H+-transporting ATPase subunit E
MAYEVNKSVQTLVDKIYQDGIEKVNQERDQIIKNAEKKATEIIEEAKQKAEQLLTTAKQESLLQRNQVLTDMKLGSNQLLSDLKQKINDLIIHKLTESSVKDIMDNENFINELLRDLIQQWRAQFDGQNSYEVILPEGKEKTLSIYLEQQIPNIFKDEVHLKEHSEVLNGFIIHHRQQKISISFTEEDFRQYLKTFLKPKTFALLFQP